MCLIAGGMGLNLKDKFIRMILTGKHRGPDSFGVWTDLGVFKSGDFSKISEIPEGSVGLLQCRLAMTGSKGFTQPFFNDIVLVHNGEIYNYRQLRDYLEGRGVEFETDVDSEVVLRLLEHLLSKGLSVHEAVKRAMIMMNGDYAVAFFWRGNIYLFRDPVGIRPLYFSPNGFFASEKKVLWAIGEKAVPVGPGELVRLSPRGADRKKVLDIRELPWCEKEFTEERAIGALVKSLECSVRMRAGSRTGVLFSGGLDSSIVAYLASEFSDVTLYTAGVEDSPDVEWARKASDELGIPLKEVLLTKEDVENIVEKVIFAIEEPSFMNLAIGVPLYFATALAASDGLKVLLSGQGADELFGGYAKYLEDPGLMERDLLELGEKNLARDDKIAMYNGVETRYPYLALPLVRLALKMPHGMKIKNSVRKWVLRKAAERMGLPTDVVWREKKAAQYGSGSQKILMKLARERKMKPSEFAEFLFRKVFGSVGWP
ncbi:asparagine synthase (glutamine-hydrolyzing) [Thermococcus gorgonarius]|uniref:Putative asparagine synthetase [glutamine-hydrolyzing] n=1 Tax=Thermococcus gorgonarius TaxID=71997 RepID=A0A2Z2M569_THEGO|nr:asparagine synthase (glutamine-hydrolyzing) [Thermococcus gorgonarius]ASJ00159.1 asparagine synthase [Thermococcus gorgonarius]